MRPGPCWNNLPNPRAIDGFKGPLCSRRGGEKRGNGKDWMGWRRERMGGSFEHFGRARYGLQVSLQPIGGGVAAAYVHLCVCE